MRRLLPALLAVFSLTTMTDAFAHDFAPGQVWSYRTRPGEAGSTLLINKVDTDARLGPIFHISVHGVKVRNPRAASGVTTALPHFPVSKQTLDASVLALQRESAPDPAYQEGYATWKRAFDTGEAGVFTATVAEIVGIVEQSINSP